MEAIILASGIGKRLGKLGEKKPKCLLELSKKLKIIDKLIKELRGVKKINIVVGYKKKLVKNYLSKKNKNINYIFNKDFKTKGNFFSVLICKKKINGNFILLDADIILPKNSLQKFIKDKRKNLVMTNPKNYFNSDDVVLNLNKKKIINNVSIKKNFNNQKTKFASAGVIKMSKDAKNFFFKELEKLQQTGNYNFYYEDSYKNLFCNKKFYISPLKKERLEVDTLSDYKKALSILTRKNFYV